MNIGPYEIVEILENNNVKILIEQNKTVHVDRIKPAHIPDQGQG